MPWLYLLRHGISSPDGSDPPLSEEGIRRMEQEARGMARLGLRFDAILTSPLQRGTGTARIVAQRLGPHGFVEVAGALEPGASLRGLLSHLEKHDRAESLLLVGHEPDMGRIIGELLGVERSLPLPKGGLCCLEVAAWPPQAPATLRFLLPPEVLGALA